MTRRSKILGCGSYLPERVVTNAELAKTVDTSDEWIVERSGIRQRHIASLGKETGNSGIKFCLGLGLTITADRL